MTFYTLQCPVCKRKAYYNPKIMPQDAWCRGNKDTKHPYTRMVPLTTTVKGMEEGTHKPTSQSITLT